MGAGGHCVCDEKSFTALNYLYVGLTEMLFH